MRAHQRLSGLGRAFDLPRSRSVATVWIDLRRSGASVPVPASEDADVDEAVSVLLAGEPDAFATGSPVVIRLPADTPAARAVAWFDALQARGVGVALRVPDPP